MVLAVVASISHGYTAYKFYGMGKAVTKTQILVRVEKDTKEYAKIKKKVKSLDDTALVERYCKWVYDVPYDECVRTTIPVDRKSTD